MVYMPSSFEDLEELEEDKNEIQNKADEINKMFFALVNENPEAIKHLYQRFCDTPVAKPGDDYLQIGIRQGKADLVRMIIQAAETFNQQ